MKKMYLSVMNHISKIIQFIVAIVLLFMALLMFIEVIRRYFFGMQFPWSEELIRYLAVWIAFLGGAAAFKEKALVCFDLVSEKFKDVSKLYLQLVSNTIVVIFLVFIFYLGMKAVLSPSTYLQISAGLGWSMSFVYAAIPVGTGLMIIFALNNYMEIMDGYRSKRQNGQQEVNR